MEHRCALVLYSGSVVLCAKRGPSSCDFLQLKARGSTSALIKVNRRLIMPAVIHASRSTPSSRICAPLQPCLDELPTTWFCRWQLPKQMDSLSFTSTDLTTQALC